MLLPKDHRRGVVAQHRGLAGLVLPSAPVLEFADWQVAFRRPNHRYRVALGRNGHVNFRHGFLHWRPSMPPVVGLRLTGRTGPVPRRTPRISPLSGWRTISTGAFCDS